MMQRKSILFLTIWFLIHSFSNPYAMESLSRKDLEPIRYVSQFTLPPEEAINILSSRWTTGNKGKLATYLGVSDGPLRTLMTEKKANKALQMLNISLIEKVDLWDGLTDILKCRTILGQLIRITTLHNVATQMEIVPDKLQSFMNGNNDLEVMTLLPKVSLDNWQRVGQLHSPTVVKRLVATYDGKARSGEMVFVQSIRAGFQVDAQFQILFASPDRPEGYVPEETTQLQTMMQKHLAYFKSAVKELKAADPNVTHENLSNLVGAMSIQSSPTPGRGKVYVESPGKQRELQEHSQISHTVDRRFYTEGVTPPNFLSVIDEGTRESYANTRLQGDTYDGDRKYPMKTYSYSHLLPNGSIITFDRGHGCDHADTIEHLGIMSTYDPDNYVPQNSYYNEHIRNPLVNMIRKTGGSYREICLYHPTPRLTDNARIPEAFVFIELYDNEPTAAYFFPNFIDYEALDFERKNKSQYLNYLSLFRVDPLMDYFFIPFMQVHNPCLELRNKGFIFAHRVYQDISTAFNNMTEDALPPRARSVLIKSIMNQSIDSAAILDFEGLLSLETAINHYASDRIYWELDDRPVLDKQQAFDSQILQLPPEYQVAYATVKRKFPIESQNEKKLKENIMQCLGGFVELTVGKEQERLKLILGGEKVKNIELARKYLSVAMSKIRKGEYDDRGLRGIQQIFMFVPEFEDWSIVEELDELFQDASNCRKAIEDEFICWPTPVVSYASEQEDKIRHEFTFGGVLTRKLEIAKDQITKRNADFYVLFCALKIIAFDSVAETILTFHTAYDAISSLPILQTSLSEKKDIADFLYENGYQEQQMEWIQKMNDHFFNEEPTQENAKLLASWLSTGNGCIKKDISLAKKVRLVGNENYTIY